MRTITLGDDQELDPPVQNPLSPRQWPLDYPSASTPVLVSPLGLFFGYISHTTVCIDNLDSKRLHPCNSLPKVSKPSRAESALRHLSIGLLALLNLLGPLPLPSCSDLQISTCDTPPGCLGKADGRTRQSRSLHFASIWLAELRIHNNFNAFALLLQRLHF